jgi:adenosine/AMP kinase
MVSSVPNCRFGIAFCEASGKCLVRWTGNDDEMIEVARKNAANIGCGHSFIISIRDAFPLNFLNAVKSVNVVCSIHCATANHVDVVIAQNDRGRGILGVIDGERPKGIEGDEDRSWRIDFLRKIGYKQS